MPEMELLKFAKEIDRAEEAEMVAENNLNAPACELSEHRPLMMIDQSINQSVNQ
jgi:hypothetical protein